MANFIKEDEEVCTHKTSLNDARHRFNDASNAFEAFLMDRKYGNFTLSSALPKSAQKQTQLAIASAYTCAVHFSETEDKTSKKIAEKLLESATMLLASISNLTNELEAHRARIDDLIDANKRQKSK